MGKTWSFPGPSQYPVRDSNPPHRIKVGDIVCPPRQLRTDAGRGRLTRRHGHLKRPARTRGLSHSRQIEYQQQGILHGTQLVMRQVSSSLAQRTCVHGGNHLAKDLRRLVLDRDLWVKAGSEHRARRWADDDCGEGEQIVGLDDHRVTAALLNVTAFAWEPDLMDITADHAASP